MQLYIKAILIVILLLCLAPMPYGYYELVRVLAIIAFAYLAYCHFKAEEEGMGILFVGLALLFQPFFKIALGRTLWNVVDVIVAILLVLLFVRNRNTSKK